MPSTTESRRIFQQNKRGATVVEFAVIASLLLTILFGILEFALIFMQDHLVENGAREGMRVGVRANNYTTFGGVPADSECTLPRCDRKLATEQAVLDYLDIFYPDLNAAENISVTRNANGNQPLLSVTVRANNFLPALISALVPGYTTPRTFTYTATGFYENPDEFARENP